MSFGPFFNSYYIPARTEYCWAQKIDFKLIIHFPMRIFTVEMSVWLQNLQKYIFKIGVENFLTIHKILDR